jgi:hypothetical protein
VQFFEILALVSAYQIHSKKQHLDLGKKEGGHGNKNGKDLTINKENNIQMDAML